MRLLALAFVFALVPASMVSSQEPVERVHEDDPFPVVGWPDGDPVAGRQAFEDLKCYSCHAVPADPSIAPLREGLESLGPDLAPQAEQKSRLFMIRQIVLPGSDQGGGETHMGSFADVMTIRQLTDLVAYLELLDG